LASEFLTRRPEASLREVARAAGISTGTVRDVRRRLARGDDPVRIRRRTHEPGARSPERAWASGDPPARAPSSVPIRDRASILRSLRSDPSLRFTESGRELLRWLHLRALGPDGWESALDEIPAHCTFSIAELADRCSDDWRRLATELRERARGATGGHAVAG
jgi:hypothetical protein